MHNRTSAAGRAVAAGRTMTAGWAAALGVVVAAGLTGCETNPATGKSQLTLLMSKESEVALGAENAPLLVQEYGGETRDPTIKAYVTEVGRKLAEQTEGDYPTLPWEFHFLDSDVVNAFALPGGQVFMSKGLAVKLSNEAELAFVLGHEVGHVTARHVLDRMNRGALEQVVGTTAEVIGQASDNAVVRSAGPVIQSGTGLFLMSFDRGQELESDALGMRYMTKAGYHPDGARGAMQVLADLGGSGQPEFLSTHPDPANRLAKIQRELATTYANEAADSSRVKGVDAYRTRMLSRLGVVGRAGAGLDGTSGAIALHAPGTWCAVCAEDAASSTGG